MRTLGKQMIAAAVIVLISIISAAALVATKKKPRKREEQVAAPLVDTLEAHVVDAKMEIEGTGTVRPATVTSIVPQVSGRVVSIHPGLVNGGRFRAGAPRGLAARRSPIQIPPRARGLRIPSRR